MAQNMIYVVSKGVFDVISDPLVEKKFITQVILLRFALLELIL